jgi:SAM-dependent methyltransferase
VGDVVAITGAELVDKDSGARYRLALPDGHGGAVRNRIKQALVEIFWLPAYLHLYRRALRREGDARDERAALFRDFTAERPGERCLQIGVRGTKFGPNWVAVDLFDESPEIDFHYDVADMGFENGTFDRVVCNAVLEHVPDPHASLEEMFRVLKPGGQIWVEVPFHQPYHPHPGDYWRVTPQGLERWMARFRPLRTGVFSIARCWFYTGSFFWGEKRAE